MAESPNQPRAYSFGLYELDGGTGELRKGGKARPRLQGQPLEVLLVLLDRPGEVVTREELRQRLWPADTFVDYDHSLNAAVNKLRDALGDTADNSRFIQTLPRRGYRFIVPVQILNGTPGPSMAARISGLDTTPTGSSEIHSYVLSDAQDLPAASHAVVQLLFSLIQVMYLTFYVLSLAHFHRLQDLLATTMQSPRLPFVLVILTASVGIPLRLYLLSAAAFGYRGLPGKFLRLFPFLLILDEMWALAPFLLANEIGMGLALAATAALVYVPFSQRSLLLMGHGESRKT